MLLGKHVSIAGGIDKAPGRAREIGCNSLQIFAKNPRGWRGRQLKDKEIEKVKKLMNEMEMGPLVVHSTYLINLATPREDLWEKSIAGLIDDYTRAGKLNSDFLVVHPGNHTGKGIEYGIERITNAINRVFESVENSTYLLLENVAGAGTSIGSNFRQLHDIIKGIEDKNRLGICLDTCHAYAAGYDLSTRNGIDEMIMEIEDILGLNYLKVIHINDSKHPISSNKDEHAHIGEGYIGLKGFRELVNHPKLKNLPFILETPQFKGQDKDVELILSLRKD